MKHDPRVSHEAERHEYEVRRWVDEAGMLMEELGMPRMAGRVLGYLLICDPPEQSAAELADALNASAGSISSATRYLIQVGMIERRSRRGERRDYFRLGPGIWARMMRLRMALVADFVALAERGLAVAGESPPESRARLQEARDYFAFVERRVLPTLGEWEHEQEAEP